MPSSYTTSLRFELQFTGENLNLWGDKLNAALARADDAIAGWLTKPLTGNYVLTTANGGADEARRAMLKFTGTGAFTVTVPAVAKRYDVWNACAGDLTLTNGSASVVVKAGEVVAVVTDGAADFRRVQATDFGGATLTNVARVAGLSAPSANGDAATKKYVDDTAFAMAGGALPGQAGNAGKFLTTDGTLASWGALSGAGLASYSSYTVTVTAAAASDVRGGSDTSKALTSAALMISAARQTLIDAATIAFNTANGYNATVSPSVSGRTIGAPTGVYDGLTISLEVVNTAGGALTVSWASGVGGWDFGFAGAPSMPTTAGAYLLVTAMYNGRTGKWDANARRSTT